MTEPLGTPTHITIHWTAGSGLQTFPEYHFCIQADGEVVHTLPIAEKGAHTWRRNSGNVGMSMCCCPPSHPPTPVQIEHTAKLVAEVCHRFGIPVQGKYVGPSYKQVDGELVTIGTADHPTVTDHAHYARADGYYPDRWDIERYLEPILAKARWYLDALVAGSILVEFL